MKRVALLIAFLGSSGPAVAQSSECQSVAKASDRLACYDRAMPPPGSRGKAATVTPASSAKNAGGDPLAAENARLDAKIRNICRGC